MIKTRFEIQSINYEKCFENLIPKLTKESRENNYLLCGAGDPFFLIPARIKKLFLPGGYF
jgi:hypothetical protein